MDYEFKMAKRGMQVYKESIQRKGDAEEWICARREARGEKRKESRRTQGGEFSGNEEVARNKSKEGSNDCEGGRARKGMQVCKNCKEVRGSRAKKCKKGYARRTHGRNDRRRRVQVCKNCKQGTA
jgi:hypothetical protein